MHSEDSIVANAYEAVSYKNIQITQCFKQQKIKKH